MEKFFVFIFQNTNFNLKQTGINKQLKDLHHLLTIASPTLADYLKKTNSSNMYFCFRWLLVLFKREFIHSDIVRLWEVLWTDLPCENFHLLICVAILDGEKDTIIKENYGSNEILKVSISVISFFILICPSRIYILSIYEQSYIFSM